MANPGGGGNAKSAGFKAMFEKAAADSAPAPLSKPGPGLLRAASHAVINTGVTTKPVTAPVSPSKPAPLQRAGSFNAKVAVATAAEPAVPEWQLKRQAKLAAQPQPEPKPVTPPPEPVHTPPAAAAAKPQTAPAQLARAPTLSRMGTGLKVAGAAVVGTSPAGSPAGSPTSRSRSLSGQPADDKSHKEEPKEDPNKWIKNPPHLDGVGDMSSLIYLDPPNILWNLQKRYEKAEIYTAISKVLVAINPYEMHDVYSGWHINEYRRQAHLRLNTLPPHVFSVAQQAYHQMEITDSNQSMIVCGESGSGKTESAKHLMRYFAYNSKKKDTGTDEAKEKAASDREKAEHDRKTAAGGDDEDEGFQVEEASIEKQVLAANPILEAFGNAKTILNNNSSRFGKFTKLVFDEEHINGHPATHNDDPDAPPRKKVINPKFICGSFIETYLLEKSRVCKQEAGERNYHVFYHLCSDGLPADVRKKLYLEAPEKYAYLLGGKTYTVDGINDSKLMKGLQKSMTALKIAAPAQDEIFRIVSGVLHLGNIKFKPLTADSVEVEKDCTEGLKQCAELFGVDEKTLTARLTTRNITVSKSVITKPLSKADAEANRDAMAKALYNGLFLWVVHHINGELFPVEARKDDLKWIGILDVFGFESFANNSFEQFCINFANETLQQYFNTYILSSEQDEYRIEAIFWHPIKVPDNQDVLDLIDLPPKGILSTLDSACRTPKADDKSFVSSLFEIHRKHPRLAMVTRVPNKATKGGFDAINGFSVKHYAGTVIYNAKEFLPKNADSTHPDTIALFVGSKLKVVAELFGENGGAPSRHGFVSTGYVFSQQLRSLMNLLHQTTPYFVRCVKPNPNKKPRSFLWDYTRPQLECGGLIEALRILKLGYPTRVSYVKLYERYGKILKPEPPNLNKRDFSEAILVVCGKGILDVKEYQLGLTKVFFRPGKQSFLEDLLHSGQELSAATIKEIKKYLLHKRVARARASVKVHARFTLRLRRMRGLVRFQKLTAVIAKACKAFFTPLKQIRRTNAANVLRANILMHLHAAHYDALKHAAVRLGVLRKYHKARVAIKKELDKRIAVKREIARKLKEEEERMAALAKIEDEIKEVKHGLSNLTGEEKILESDLMQQINSGSLLIDVINRINPNFKLKSVPNAKSPIQLQENWSTVLRGMTGLGVNKKLLNFTGDDGMSTDRDRFTSKILPALLELIKIGYQRAPALKPKPVPVEHKDDEVHGTAAGGAGSAPAVEVHTHQSEDKSEYLPPLKVGPTSDTFFAIVQRGSFFGVYRSGSSVPAAEKAAGPVRAYIQAVDPGVFSWRGKDEKKTELGKIDLSIVTAIRAGREDGNDVDPNAPAPAPAPAAVAATPVMAVVVNTAVATSAAKPGDAPKPAEVKAKGWFTLFCGADQPAITVQADTIDLRDQWLRALRYCTRNVKEIKALAKPKGDPFRGSLVYAKLMEEVEDLRSNTDKERAAAVAAASAAASASANADALKASEAAHKDALAASERKWNDLLAQKESELATARTEATAKQTEFASQLAAKETEFGAKLKAAEADQRLSAATQAKLDAYTAQVAQLTRQLSETDAKLQDLIKNPPLPPPEIIKQRQIIQIEQIFVDPTGPAKPLVADLDVSSVSDEKELRSLIAQLHKRNTQLEDVVALARLYFAGYLHMNDHRTESKLFTEKHVKLDRTALDAANIGAANLNGDSTVERDIKIGEHQTKAAKIKAQRDMMKTMRVIKKKDRMRAGSASLVAPNAGGAESPSPVSTSRSLLPALNDEKSAPAKEDEKDSAAEVRARSPSQDFSATDDAPLAAAASSTVAGAVAAGAPTTSDPATAGVLASPSVSVRSVAGDATAAPAKAWTIGFVRASHCFNRMTAFGAPILIDVRSVELYRAGHLPTAINLPLTADDLKAGTTLADMESRVNKSDSMQFKRRARRTVLIYGAADTKADTPELSADPTAVFLARALQSEGKVLGADVMINGWTSFHAAYPFLDCAIVSESELKSGRHRHLPVVPWFPSEIVDGFLYLGNGDDAHNYERLKRLGVTRVLNCTAEVDIQADVAADSSIKTEQFHLSDDEKTDITAHFARAFEFIDAAKATPGARVLVHCAQGISRSATVVIAYLMKSRSCSLKEAFDICKTARPKVLPNAGFWEQLQAFEVKYWPGAKGDIANSTLKECVDLGLVVSPKNLEPMNIPRTADEDDDDDEDDANDSDSENKNEDEAGGDEQFVRSRVGGSPIAVRSAAAEERARQRAAQKLKANEWKAKAEADALAKERELLPKEEIVRLEWFEVVGRASVDPETPFLLGMCFEDGRGVKKDQKKAAHWWEVAASRGHAASHHVLALAYAHGRGVPKNEARAIELLNTAANAPHKYAKSMFTLGVFHSSGRCGLARDMRAAVSWYQRASDAGHVHALFNLAVCYLLGSGVASKDERRAVSLYEKAANLGYAGAQFNMGVFYANGSYGLKRDMKQALIWYDRAARQGYASAAFNLAACYAAGTGIVRDAVKAARWYEAAATAGHANAQFNLALCYDHGTGVLRDEKRAFEWYSAAASKQHAKAAYNQGLCYRYGRGVNVDLVKAAAAYEVSAKAGYVLAQYNLAAAYSDGKGVLKDQKRAAEWYTRAAEQKYPNAEYNLAVYYVHGTGVPKDDAKAFALFKSAAGAGNARAQRWLGLMYEEGKAPSTVPAVPSPVNAAPAITPTSGADLAKAFEYMKLAANQGDAVAQYRLGQWYRAGRGEVVRNEQLALAYLKAAAAQGHPGASIALQEIRATL